MKFENFGQRGFTSEENYRSAISLQNPNAETSIKYCIFENTFNTAIFARRAKNVKILQNLICDTVEDGIRVIGQTRNFEISKNLVKNVRHRLLHPEISTEGSKGFRIWPSGVRIDEITDEENFIFNGNHVMNIDGFGFRIKGSKCAQIELDCETTSGDLSSNATSSGTNSVNGALHCVSIWQNSQNSCSKIENFKVENCVDYGIYAQLTSSMIAQNIEISDSSTGITAWVSAEIKFEN